MFEFENPGVNEMQLGEIIFYQPTGGHASAQTVYPAPVSF
jgi:hypothetical protein